MKQAKLSIFILILSTSLAQVGNNSSVMNPNRASEAELIALTHSNKDVAAKLIEKRPFLSMTNLDTYLASWLNEDQRKELYVKLFIPINLNSASREEILLVPGVGKKMAHEFEEYRPYVHIKQFRREIKKYVNDEELARLEQYVFVPIDLNTASDDDILSIPGVGKRMLHEFKEYRPYKNIEQFRKEIGKYVDKSEVSRLERYVMISDQ